MFQCVWLFSQATPYALPRDFRPDHSGVVLEVNSVANLIVHSKLPGSWKRPSMLKWLIGKAGHTKVLVEDGHDTVLLNADGQVDLLLPAGVDPETNNRIYFRAAEVAAALPEYAGGTRG